MGVEAQKIDPGEAPVSEAWALVKAHCHGRLEDCTVEDFPESTILFELAKALHLPVGQECGYSMSYGWQGNVVTAQCIITPPGVGAHEVGGLPEMVWKRAFVRAAARVFQGPHHQ